MESRSDLIVNLFLTFSSTKISLIQYPLILCIGLSSKDGKSPLIKEFQTLSHVPRSQPNQESGDSPNRPLISYLGDPTTLSGCTRTLSVNNMTLMSTLDLTDWILKQKMFHYL